MSGVLGHRGDLFRIQVAGHVDVALLEQKALARGFLDVAEDDAGERGLLLVVRVALEDEDLVGLPVAHDVGAGAGILGLEPVIAEIAVLLVLDQELLVDDRGDRVAEAVENQGRRVGLVDLEGHLERAGLLDLVLHVVLRQAELAQDEGRGLVERHGAVERIHHVFGGDRVARGELAVGLDLERDRSCRRARRSRTRRPDRRSWTRP